MRKNVLAGAILALAVAFGTEQSPAEAAECAAMVDRVRALLMIEEAGHHEAEARVICAAKKHDAQAAAMAYLRHLSERHGDVQITLDGDARRECASRLWTMAELLALPDEVYKLGAVVQRCSGADNQPVRAAALMMAAYRENSW